MRPACSQSRYTGQEEGGLDLLCCYRKKGCVRARARVGQGEEGTGRCPDCIFPLPFLSEVPPHRARGDCCRRPRSPAATAPRPLWAPLAQLIWQGGPQAPVEPRHLLQGLPVTSFHDLGHLPMSRDSPESLTCHVTETGLGLTASCGTEGSAPGAPHRTFPVQSPSWGWLQAEGSSEEGTQRRC